MALEGEIFLFSSYTRPVCFKKWLFPNPFAKGPRCRSNNNDIVLLFESFSFNRFQLRGSRKIYHVSYSFTFMLFNNYTELPTKKIEGRRKKWKLASSTVHLRLKNYPTKFFLKKKKSPNFTQIDYLKFALSKYCF